MRILDIYGPRPHDKWIIGNREYQVTRAASGDSGTGASI